MWNFSFWKDQKETFNLSGCYSLTSAEKIVKVYGYFWSTKWPTRGNALLFEAILKQSASFSLIICTSSLSSRTNWLTKGWFILSKTQCLRMWSCCSPSMEYGRSLENQCCALLFSGIPLWCNSPQNTRLPFLLHQPTRRCYKSIPIPLSNDIPLLHPKVCGFQPWWRSRKAPWKSGIHAEMVGLFCVSHSCPDGFQEIPALLFFAIPGALGWLVNARWYILQAPFHLLPLGLPDTSSSLRSVLHCRRKFCLWEQLLDGLYAPPAANAGV